MKVSTILQRIIHVGPILVLALLILASSTIPPGDHTERIRAYTRDVEFDYLGWTLDAVGVKLNQIALGISSYLTSETQRQLVLDYLELVYSIWQTEAQLNIIYTNPNITDPQAASAELRVELDEMYAQREQLAPVAEGILQTQLSNVAGDMDLTLGGQPIPPVLFHSSPSPWALIVSPRDEIRQEANISLVPELTVDQHASLEEQVDRELDVSSLIVPIGGIGVYPTMINETSNLPWLSEVISHEWTHNFLSLRPLGVNYFSSPELRTMNETAASIAGKEMGRAILERYYPESLPPPPAPQSEIPEQEIPTPEPAAFDFRAEMHETRVTVDKLLEEGKIEQAEQYMEARREVFWENGYRHIRKLNQAFFAFYGAYADQPGGAAGEDPVGSAVRELRVQSPSLASFLNRISWMTSFEQLQRAVESGAN